MKICVFHNIHLIYYFKEKLDSLTLQNRLNYKKSTSDYKYNISIKDYESKMSPETISALQNGSTEEKLNMLKLMIDNDHEDVKIYALLKLTEFTENQDLKIMNNDIFKILTTLVFEADLNKQIKVVFCLLNF